MSTEQPENDPRRESGEGWGSSPPPAGGPSGPGEEGVPPEGRGGGTPQGPPEGTPDPYGGPPPPPPPGGGAGSPYDAPPPRPPGAYGGGPYGSPYGHTGEDPLAGMPPLANRGKRLLARIVDALIIGIPVGILTALAAGGEAVLGTGGSGNTYWQQAVYVLVYLVYEGLMLTQSGQTVGKKLVKIRVAMLDDGSVPGGSPGWLRAGVYSIPPLVPCLGFVFWLVNVLFCTWDKPYQQCVHDKAARTVVVEAR